MLPNIRSSKQGSKEKVERDVPTTCQQFRKQLALYPTMDISEANQRIKFWCIIKYR